MRITIVTPTLNRAAFLPAAIESVLAQRYDDLEHIVVDGLSTDATPEVLARYPHLRIIRESDTGLYDALNKGIRAATGEIVGHLNSDDTYAPGAFAAVAAGFSDPAVEAVCGGAEILHSDGRLKTRFALPENVALSFENATMGSPIPNARFFRRSFYERVGLYETRFRVAADRHFLFRAARQQPKTATTMEVLYRYHAHGGSLTFGSGAAQEARWRDEYLQMAEDFLADPTMDPEARTFLRRWHLRESAQAALRSESWEQGWAYARRGLAVNAAWPWMYLRHWGGALLGR